MSLHTFAPMSLGGRTVAAPSTLTSRTSFGAGLSALQSKRRLRAAAQLRSPSQRVVEVSAKGAYICADCGWIYDGRESFESLPTSFKCPVCKSPKRRFKAFAGKGAGNSQSAMDARYAALKGGKSASTATKESDQPVAIYAAVGGAVILALAYFLGNAAVN